jgi:hypothetical protein
MSNTDPEPLGSLKAKDIRDILPNPLFFKYTGNKKKYKDHGSAELYNQKIKLIEKDGLKSLEKIKKQVEKNIKKSRNMPDYNANNTYLERVKRYIDKRLKKIKDTEEWQKNYEEKKKEGDYGFGRQSRKKSKKKSKKKQNKSKKQKK